MRENRAPLFYVPSDVQTCGMKQMDVGRTQFETHIYNRVRLKSRLCEYVRI